MSERPDLLSLPKKRRKALAVSAKKNEERWNQSMLTWIFENDLQKREQQNGRSQGEGDDQG